MASNQLRKLASKRYKKNALISVFIKSRNKANTQNAKPAHIVILDADKIPQY